LDLGLKDQVALVAGASAGIGAAAARALSAAGARLALAARPSRALRDLAVQLGAAETPADFTTATAGREAVKATLARYGRLDILVVSLGAAQGGPFWDLPDEVWHDAFALKFMGMIRLLRAAAPVMQAQGSGAIVAVVGNNGHEPQARLGPGSAVNAASLAALKALADEVAPAGVRVNAINPGPTRTGRWDGLMANLARRSGRTAAEEEAAQLARIPLGRINTAEEIGRMIAMLASPLTGAMTGTAVTIDGGASRGLP
jgi:3-oxoacyl-[acyl-carrier protein] reductase